LEFASMTRRVALVTGASRGLGPEIARSLASDGWSVAVNYSQDDAGAAACVASIEAAHQIAQPFRFDVTAEEAVVAGVDKIRTSLGPIDLIVNNASGPQGAVPIEQQDWPLYERHLRFFVKAPLLLLKAVLDDWRARRSGRIINIGTSAFDDGSPRDAHYVAAKGAMLGLTRSWANELGPDGITVNMVTPSWTLVERHEGVRPEALARHTARIPLGRMGEPEDLAAMVSFIASPPADFITGQNIRINGGRYFG
jgi:3-oxoacyl-[acyl-carrier protein] reductase